jgi:mannose-1-phosphate guanylyltransferase
MLGHTKRAPGGALWAIVLAGGQGIRLLPLVRELYGDERPKQFARIVCTKSLLRQTLDRVGLQIPAVQTVIATCREHGKYMAEEFAEMPSQRIIVQPDDRGTAAGVLFPAHWIYSQDPNTVVAVFPSDHFILKESVFMNHIANLAGFVLQQPTRLVLLGAPADAPETEYGWIQPGEPLGHVGANPVRQVTRFWEKPSEKQARTCLASGCLWNTMVIVAKLSTLLEAGQRLLPDLTAYMACAADHLAAGRHSEMEQIYGLAPKADFCRLILEACPSLLAVFTPPELTWSDLGTPRRVKQTLALVASKGIA